MEGLGSKSGKILAPLMTLMMACTTEGQSSDVQMNAALEAFTDETNALASQFEAAADNALTMKAVFKATADQSGEIIMIKDGDTFGCLNSKAGDGFVCEEAPYSSKSEDPNLVTLNRDDSKIFAVGEADTDVQIVHRMEGGKKQDSATMFVTDTNCGISVLKGKGNSSENTSNPEIVGRCAKLKKNLRDRIAAVMEKAMLVQKIFGN